MDEMRTADTLAKLSWLETATVRAYDTVESRLADEDLLQRFGGFRSDHARHLSRMHRLLEKTAGGAEPSAEFIALVREELSLVENTPDTREMLRHLLLVERANASFFTDMLAEDLPAEAEQLLAEASEEESRHVQALEASLPPVVPIVRAPAPSEGPARGESAVSAGGAERQEATGGRGVSSEGVVIGEMGAEASGGVGVTPEGGLIPGAVPERLPQSPQQKAMDAAIKGHGGPTPEPPGYHADEPHES